MEWKETSLKKDTISRQDYSSRDLFVRQRVGRTESRIYVRKQEKEKIDLPRTVRRTMKSKWPEVVGPLLNVDLLAYNRRSRNCLHWSSILAIGAEDTVKA